MSLRGRRGPRSLRRVLAALVAGLAVVLEPILIAAAIIGILSTASDYRDGAERAQGRQQVANALLTDLLSAQSANRAYILLPSGDNLAEYQVARDQYPAAMEELRERVRGEPELEASADAVDGRQLWFAEAEVGLIRLRRQGREQEAIRRINQGLGEARFNAFRTEHSRKLLEGIERERADALAANDRRGLLTFAAICAAALLTLIVVGVASASSGAGSGGRWRCSARAAASPRGRLSDPIPPSRDAVRELAELMEGFNLMQRRSRASATRSPRGPARGGSAPSGSSGRRSRAGCSPSACRASGVSASPRATSRPSGRCWWAATSTTPSRWSTGGSR